MYETRNEAMAVCGDNAVIQVEGGYQVVTWGEYYNRIREEAESLFDGGWKSCDKDEMMEAYGFDEEHAETICNEIAAIEEETL